jgi:hypothetical protein
MQEQVTEPLIVVAVVEGVVMIRGLFLAAAAVLVL